MRKIVVRFVVNLILGEIVGLIVNWGEERLVIYRAWFILNIW